MQMKDSEHGEVLVVTPLDKRIDAYGSSDFKGQMVDRINSGRNLIVMDLSNVDFIDSSGLGAIVSILKTLGNNGTLRICGMKDTIMGLFRLTRLDRVFHIHPTVEDALKAMRGADASGNVKQ